MVVVGLYLFVIWGVQGMIYSASKGEFDYTTLIFTFVGLVLMALPFIMWKIKKVLKKNAPPEDKSVISQKIIEKLEKRAETSKKILLVLLLGSALGIVLWILTLAGVFPPDMIPINTLVMFGLIVLGIIYANKYVPAKKNLAVLKSCERPVEFYLSGIENIPPTTSGVAIIGENAIVFLKKNLILPYECMYWIYKKAYSVYGARIVENVVFHTLQGEEFELSMHNDELMQLLEYKAEKFPQNIVIGYGRKQRKQFECMMKQNKKGN